MKNIMRSKGKVTRAFLNGAIYESQRLNDFSSLVDNEQNLENKEYYKRHLKWYMRLRWTFVICIVLIIATVLYDHL